MSIKTNFFDGLAGGVTAADLISPWAVNRSDGVIGAADMMVSQSSPAALSVSVGAGVAFKSGYEIRSDSAVTVALSANTSGYNRIDLIVLNINASGLTSFFSVIQGTPSSSPVAPAAGALQLPLAQVLVANNASVINTNVITDLRTPSTSLVLPDWIPFAQTVSYSSSAAPNFVATTAGNVTAMIRPSMKIKAVQGGATKYFKVMDSSYSTATGLTSLTLYGGTDYTLTSSAITYFAYTAAPAPAGFPLHPDKWTVILKSSSQYSQSTPPSGTWYNLGGISFMVPVGLWDISAEATVRADYATGVTELRAALSTSNSSSSDYDMLRYSIGSLYAIMNFRASKTVSISSPTTFYLLEQNSGGSADGIFVLGDRGTTILKAVCRY